MIKANQIFVDQYEKAVSRLVLFALTELPFSLGVKRFISVLKGTQSTFVIDNELHLLSSFSTFSSCTADYLKTIIEELKSQELIAVNNISTFNHMPVLSITEKGRDFLNGDIEVDVQFVHKGLESEIIKLSEEDLLLFDQLKVLRKELALENEVPAYMVCSDQVLRGIISAKPKTVENLLEINGIGTRFCEKYGDAFLKAMNDSSKEKRDKKEKGAEKKKKS